VEVLAAVGGNSSVDRALQNPPASDEQVFDPFRYLAKDTPKTVAAPALLAGEKRLEGAEEADEIGAFALFLILAQRLDFQQAMRAVDGWGGDSLVIYEGDGGQCSRSRLMGDTPTDTDEMAAALDAWAKTMPPGVASTTRHGTEVELVSCDPGADFKIGPNRIDEAIRYPLTRTAVALATISAASVPWEYARCYAGALSEQVSLADIASDAPPKAAQQKMVRAAEGCRR
jgi:hypothetical protein